MRGVWHAPRQNEYCSVVFFALHPRRPTTQRPDPDVTDKVSDQTLEQVRDNHQEAASGRGEPPP